MLRAARCARSSRSPPTRLTHTPLATPLGAAGRDELVTHLSRVWQALGTPLPFLVVRDVHELARELGRLRDEPPLLDAMQRRTREWWEAVKEHYARRFEEAMCPSPTSATPADDLPHPHGGSSSTPSQ